jgi:LmbE family N-acetylglucosaminyl deacetylase
MRGPLLAVSILGGTCLSRRSLGFFLPFAIMLISIDAHASPPPPQPDAAEIQLALRKLGVVGSVLYVAAHPDDENTNLLAYLSKEKLARTAYLSLTRGDGGQNLIGSEQGPDLAVIRTQELLAARRLDGAEQFFTRARDFGYSKNPEETLRIWGKDAVLADVVQVIRRFRPDVIVTRFSPEVSETHGHHTASAQLALEAFHAAADANFHPEQLGAEVRPWQARRIFWNRSWWSIKPEDDLSGFLKMDVNAYNPLLGISCGELAADSRSMHKSQGFGVARTRAPIIEYFKLLAESEPSAPRHGSVLDGLDFSWARFKGTAALRRLVERTLRAFEPAAPYKSIPALLQIDQALDGVADAGWRAKKKAEVRDLILACAGLFSEATSADYRVVPGASIEVTATAVNRSPAKIALREVRFLGGELADGHGAADGHRARVDKPLGTAEVKRVLRVPPELPLTTPYWLALAPEPGLFRVQDPSLIGLAEAESPLAVEFVLDIDGHALTVRRPIDFKWTDPVAGERHRPLEITPAVSVRPATGVVMFPRGEARTMSVRLAAGAPSVAGTLRLEMPAGWSATPAAQPFTLSGKGAETELAFRVQPPPPSNGQQDSATGTLRAVADVGALHFAQGVSHIEHAHIPIQTVLDRSDVGLVSFAIERQGSKIGYIPGPGDEVPAALRQVGYEVTPIGDDVLAGLVPGSPALARFDAIVIGVRAFNTDETLRRAHAALMAYVEAGGTLVAQYNTNNRLAPLATPIGPFPFEIGHERVTDETAAVHFLHPDQRILNAPNRITARDFDGWIQERGLYFASTWDPRYQTVLGMNDPGETTLAGGLLWVRHGKGVFIYTGLAFFRQLPAGVPGAFRLFANLLAAGHGQDAR